MNFEQWLKAKGFDADNLNDAQRSTLQAAFDAEQLTLEAEEDDTPPKPEPGRKGKKAGKSAAKPGQHTLKATGDDPAPEQDDLQAEEDAARDEMQAEAREIVRKENERVRCIETLCAEFGDPEIKVNNQTVKLAAHAVSEGWSRDRTELEARRASRPSAPAGHAHSHEGRCTLQAMQGAFLLATGVELDNESLTNSLQAQAIGVPDFLRRNINDDQRQQFMEAAHRFSDLSLLDMARECVRLDGQYVPSRRQDVIEAAFSGGTLSKIFTTNLNVGILTRFDITEDTTQGWTVRNTNVPNFQPREVIGMQLGGGLKKLGRGGTAAHGTFADKGETYRIARYAEQIRIDDQDILDDNYSMFTEVRDQLADDCASLIPDLVFALLFANAAMGDGIALFHANHGNLRTGAALTEANLKAALTAFLTQQEGGKNIKMMATHIITPEALSFTADGLLNSVEVRQASATGGFTKNTLRGKVRVAVADSRLDNGVTDPDTETTYAGSNDDWYLADGMRPAIEVGTLRGSGGVPMIRTQPQVAGQWAMGWDVKHDAGCKSIRHQTIQKNEA